MNTNLPISITLSPVKSRKRRNSTGTIYIENTMACQDNIAMIHVVCVVIRAHMLAGEKNRDPKINFSYEIFNNDYGKNNNNYNSNNNDYKMNNNEYKSNNNEYKNNSNFIPKLNNDYYTYTDENIPKNNQQKVDLPSLKAIKDFFSSIYNKSQLESECIIMTLIYCERLIVKTKGKLVIRHDNWKSM